ncbi:MAG: glutamate--tRNA ligase [Planctomycetota bacterium]
MRSLCKREPAIPAGCGACAEHEVLMPDIVRTRFAPSPTGYLHVGGARTALFCYFLARRLGGRFVLRIEDTDQTRNIEAADRKLMEDLRWLGLQWDEGPEVGGPAAPYYQGQRLAKYQEHTRRLLDAGHAYYAMETRAELEAMRKAAQQRGEKGFRYPRPARFPTETEAEQARAEGRPVVVRFKMPARDFTVSDQILGDVTIRAAELSDFVIVKSDGWPTYNYAVVVDDADMQITHVLRGQEHLMNTPGQIALYEAFGYTPPAFAHLPIIFNMNGTKMSKRDKDRVVRDAAKAAGLDDAQIAGLAGLATDSATAPQSGAAPVSATRGSDPLAAAPRVAGAAARALVAAWRKGDVQLPGEALARLAKALAVQPPEIEIHDFRRSGYLPEVLANFIALLGWNPGTGQEKFTLAELCAQFSLDRVGKTNARFDREKLLAFNTAALEAAPMDRKLTAFKDWIAVNAESAAAMPESAAAPENGMPESAAAGAAVDSSMAPFHGLDDATLARVLEVCRGFRTFADVERKAGPLFAPDEAIRYDEKAVRKWLLKEPGSGQSSGAAVLRELQPVLAAHSDWSPAALDELIRRFATQRGVELGKVAQPLRVALTGGTISPAIGDTLALLGRDRTVARIERALRLLH